MMIENINKENLRDKIKEEENHEKREQKSLTTIYTL